MSQLCLWIYFISSIESENSKKFSGETQKLLRKSWKYDKLNKDIRTQQLLQRGLWLFFESLPQSTQCVGSLFSPVVSAKSFLWSKASNYKNTGITECPGFGCDLQRWYTLLLQPARYKFSMSWQAYVACIDTMILH